MSSEHAQADHMNLLKHLHSLEQDQILETIEEMRISGKVSDLPALIELLHQTTDPEIRRKISELMANLKENDAVPFLIDAIQNPEFAPELKVLVSCCWENGLDFSKYLSLFVDLLITNDLIISFEAYTVIMNNEHRIDPEIIDLEVNRLEKALPAISEQKRPLIIDVIDFLPSIRF